MSILTNKVKRLTYESRSNSQKLLFMLHHVKAELTMQIKCIN